MKDNKDQSKESLNSRSKRYYNLSSRVGTKKESCIRVNIRELDRIFSTI